MRRVASLLLLVVTPAPVLAQARSVGIEQVLSAPFPTELTAAPAKGRVAWVFNTRGSRNVWLAEPSAAGGAYTSRALTVYTGDDGSEIGDLSWSPDGETIVYTRGSLSPGSPTNPLSSAQGDIGREVWAIPASGGGARKLGDGHMPAVSPKGDVVAYVAGEQIWSAPLDGHTKASPLILEKGTSLHPTWSPDGSHLAFVSERSGGHSFIGVYDVARKAVVWLAPSVDQDGFPAWSPDGAHLAFVRIPTGGPEFFLSGPTGRPWSIWVADAATGQGHAIFTADTGIGSVFQPLNAEPQLFWGADDRIAFAWERTGWLQLYSIAAKGGAPTLLTPGQFEIFVASMSPNGHDVVYAGNQNDVDRQHVWRVAIAGGPPTELTPGQGIETYPVVASDNKTVAVLRSDARTPIRPAVVTAAGGALHDVAGDAIPAAFPASALVVPEPVTFSSADGVMIHAQLFSPPAGTATRRNPAVVFFHGGPIRQMLLGWHPMDAYSYMYGMNQYLASRGYVVLSVNYRGGIGYGVRFRKPAAFGPTGSSEAADIQGAGLYLRGRADVDPARIGVWGGSYGGLMTALALARYPDLFAAGVDYAGVHDWRAMLFSKGSDTTQAAARVAWQSSPMATVDQWRGPVLVVQADDDRNVPYAQAPELIAALRTRGVAVEPLIIPDETHDLLLYRSWVRFLSATGEFFDRTLHPVSQ